MAKLALIAAKARNEPNVQFNNLLHHLTYELIEECLAKIPKNSAPGVDGMTVEQARQNLSWLLPPLLKQIHQGRYEAPPVRRVYIPKADGKQRPLGVPAVIDRAIQAATAKILGEIYEQDFLPCSFGFRRDLSCHHALATASQLVSRGMAHALEVDIRDFFGSLDHGWLRRFLSLRIGDDRVLKLIDAWLKSGVMDEGQWQASERGTPQGGSISPLLANIYLHYVVDLWFDRKIKRQLRAGGSLVRYADDFVIFFRNAEDVVTVQALLKTRLAQFGLSLAEDKTHTVDLTPRPKGQGSHGRRRISFLGLSLYQTRNRKGTGLKTVFRTDALRFTRAKAEMKRRLIQVMHWEIRDQVAVINAILRGHFNYYGMPGNTKRLAAFWNLAMRQWRRCLSRRRQKGRVNWQEITRLRQQYPWVMPRLKISYKDLGSYVRL
jgi:group II intron reverse transcriptase/maturase